MRSELFKLCEENAKLRIALDESRERYKELQEQVHLATKTNPNSNPNPNSLMSITNPDLIAAGLAGLNPNTKQAANWAGSGDAITQVYLINLTICPNQLINEMIAGPKISIRSHFFLAASSLLVFLFLGVH